MSDQISFTTAAFGGFEKKQVLDYIYKLHEEADLLQLKHRKKLEEIAVAFKDLEARALEAEQRTEECQVQMQALERELRDSNQELEAAKSNIEDLQEQIFHYQELAKEAEEEPVITAALPEDEPLLTKQQALAEEEETLLLQKQQIQAEYLRMEESSAKIGRVMLDAHTKAEQVVTEANLEAKRILAQAQEVIEQQQYKAKSAIEKHRLAVQVETEARLEKAKETAKLKIMEAERESQELLANIRKMTDTAIVQLDLLRTQIAQLTQTTSGTLYELREYSRNKIVSSGLQEIPPEQAKTTAAYERLEWEQPALVLPTELLEEPEQESPQEPEPLCDPLQLDLEQELARLFSPEKDLES